MGVERIVKELKSYKKTNNVFNPWNDSNKKLDNTPLAAELRVKS
jgi:hypothetical protein